MSPDRSGDLRAARPTRNLAFGSIVHVNEKGGSFGGTEEYIALLTAALSARGVRSHLVCGVISGTVPDGLESVHIVEGLASRQPRAGTADAVAEVIADLDPDVIYLHNVFDPAAVSAVAALAGRGMLIWYVHDHYLTCLSELRWRRDIGSCAQRLGHDCLVAIGAGDCVLRYPDRALTEADLHVRTTLSRSLAAADGIVVVSEYMRRLLRDAAPHLDARLHLLTRPIRNLGELRLRHRSRPDDPAVITYAGRITPEKGLAVVIEALGLITSDSTVELRVAGVIEDNSYWSHCQRVQTLALSRNPRLSVTYLGHLDYDGTDEQLRQSDIVTIPSQWPEPLGAVALEAMSAGAAVVASNVGGLNTTIVDDHNAVHVDPGDVDAWAHAIASLLEHPQRARRLGHQAHRELAGVAIRDHLNDLHHLIASRRTSAHVIGGVLAPSDVVGNAASE
jgi:glycosyltransferase involved in cell wall biosynthesis